MGLVYGSPFQEDLSDFYEEVYEYIAVPSSVTDQVEINITWNQSSLLLGQFFNVFYSFENQDNFEEVFSPFSIQENTEIEKFFYVKIIRGKTGSQQYPTLAQVNFLVRSYELNYSRIYFEISGGVPFFCFANAVGLNKLECDIEKVIDIQEDEFLNIDDGKIFIDKINRKFHCVNRFYEGGFKKRFFTFPLVEEIDLIPSIQTDIFISGNKIYFRVDSETPEAKLLSRAIS